MTISLRSKQVDHLYHFVLFFFSFPFGLPILATLLGELLELELGNVNKKKSNLKKNYIYIYGNFASNFIGP